MYTISYTFFSEISRQHGTIYSKERFRTKKQAIEYGLELGEAFDIWKIEKDAYGYESNYISVDW